MQTAFSRAVLAPVLALALVSAASAQVVRKDVPFVPTPYEVVDRMHELADIKKGEFMMDLGSGDGRIAIAAARDYGATAVGIDIDPQRIEEANENARKAGVTDRVTFKQEDLFETPIRDADVITMYLLTAVNAKLRPRLLEELRPGTRIVSHAFDMADWEPDIYEVVERREIYLWVVPARVEGEWSVKDGERSFTVKFDQKFQKLTGTISMEGKTHPVKDGRLKGNEIVFTAEIDGKDVSYFGVIDGGTISSTDGPRGEKRAWSAVRKG